LGSYWREACNILRKIIRKWRWIIHTLRKRDDPIAKPALDWNPQGAGRRESLQKTWKRSVSEEAVKHKQ
jgi:hypothetical protein